MRAVFLDRDGVLVGSRVVDGVPHPEADPQVLAGVADACAALRRAGFRLVMVTNQPDIARGAVAAAEVDRVNERLRVELGLDDIRMCPHDDPDGCDCRKPAPGMLVAAARDAGIDLAASVMVGDRAKDVEAGRRAGTRTVFVDRHHGETSSGGPVAADATVASLVDAVPQILEWAGATAEGATRASR